MSNLPPGAYFGTLTDSAIASIGQNETPAVVLTFEITHVTAGGEWREIDKTKRDVQFYLSEAARERSFSDLRALGFNGDFDAPKFTDPELASGLELTVINEHYNGKLQDKVSIAKLKIRERKPLNVDLKRSLAAQFRTAAATSAKPSTPPPAARPAAPAAAPAASAPAPSRPAPTAASNEEPPF